MGDRCAVSMHVLPLPSEGEFARYPIRKRSPTITFAPLFLFPPSSRPVLSQPCLRQQTIGQCVDEREGDNHFLGGSDDL